jgi:hypothetical protein
MADNELADDLLTGAGKIAVFYREAAAHDLPPTGG